MIADGLTAQGRTDLAQETRRAAARLNELTRIPTRNGQEWIQGADEHRMVWTLYFLADVIEGKRRN